MGTENILENEEPAKQPEKIREFLATRLDLTKTYKKSDFVFFFGHTQREKMSKTCFSQWYPSLFTDPEDDLEFSCTEQYMMYHKAKLFGDEVMMKKIMKTKLPKTMKRYGRLVSNYDPVVWEQHKYDIVYRGNVLKFSQNPEMKEVLLATKDKILVESSPYDCIWGIKMRMSHEGVEDPNNWMGTNLLGFALMDARKTIKEQGL